MNGSLHPLVEGVLTVDGRRRYYPPGQHPASWQVRRHRELVMRLPESTHRDELLAWIDDQLAAFEECETTAKQIDLHLAQRRMRRALEEGTSE